MEFNKYALYVKAIAVIFVLALGVGGGLQGWEMFKEWAIAKKARKISNIAMQGVCQKDPSCQDWLTGTVETCVTDIAKTREDRKSPDLGKRDKRRLMGCLQKSYRSYLCRADEKCLTRVSTRYDLCFDYAYPDNNGPTDPDAPSALTGCLYGVQFVDASSTEAGVSTEEVELKKTKKKMKPMGGFSPPGKEEADKLMEELKQAGDDRKKSFNEAMDALQARDATNP